MVVHIYPHHHMHSARSLSAADTDALCMSLSHCMTPLCPWTSVIRSAFQADKGQMREAESGKILSWCDTFAPLTG
jgi:hypothetical protein